MVFFDVLNFNSLNAIKTVPVLSADYSLNRQRKLDVHKSYKIAFASLMLTAAVPASATDETSNMTVSATVVAACSIGTPDTLAFGSAITSTGTAITAQANIPVTCSSGGSYKVFLNNGTNAIGNQRNMINGSNTLRYDVYSDSARTTAFPITAAGAMAKTGTAAAVNTIVYGSIPVQTTPPVGSYGDTLLITVQY